MAAEVPAFLLKQKLQNLRDDETIIYPRLKHKINSSIVALQQLLSSSDGTDVTNSMALPFIYSAEDVVDTYLLKRMQQRRKDFLKTHHLFQYLAPLWSQKDLGKGLNKFLNDLKALPSHSSEKNNQESRVLGKTQEKDRCLVNTGRFRRWDSVAHLLDKDSNIVGRVSDMAQMVYQLMGPQEEEALRVVSVVGPGGSGKTTMVRRVYNRVDVKRHFGCCAWVCVPRELVYRNVVMSIIEQVSINRLNDVDHMNDDVLSDMLFKELINRRYLIVLDNVWDAEAWHRLTIPFPDSKKGSRVILISRDDKVVKLADPWNLPMHICRLTNENRWELLLKQMKEQEGGLTEHKDEIMAKLCHGSPLGILLLGGILLNTEPSEWSRKIDKFPSSCEDESSLPDILALSYQELPPELRACFLYMGIFPIASEVSVRRLLWLWISEGFLDGLLGKERKKWEPEDLAEFYFQTLVNRNLIEVTEWKLDGCPKMCRMPGVIHEFFFPRSVDSGLFHVRENSSFRMCRPPENYKIRRLVEYSRIKNSLDSFHDHRLRSYVSFISASRGMANREIGMFLKNVINKGGFGLLKVLDLEGVYKPMLPKSMCNLLLLRFLSLRSTVLDSIPSAIGNLPCLETLDLKHTNVTTIPSSIWKAKNLRHLYMNGVRIDAFSRKASKGSLTNLLSLRGLYVGDKKAVVNRLDRLVNLQKLGLTCHGNSLKAVAKWIEQLSNLQSLKLRSTEKFGEPSNLEVISMAQHRNLCNLYLLGSLPIPANQLSGVLPSCLRKLTLSMLNLEEDPMPVLGQLHDLSFLRLFANSYVGPQMTCVSGGFPKLRMLKLWMLGKLEHWTVQEGAMPLLQELEIRRCIQLNSLDGLEHLRSLKEFVLTDMLQGFVEKLGRSSSDKVFVTVNEWKFSRHQGK